MKNSELTNVSGDVILNNQTIKAIKPTVNFLCNMHAIEIQNSFHEFDGPFLHSSFVQNQAGYYYYFYKNLLYCLNEISSKKLNKNEPLSKFIKDYIFDTVQSEDVAQMTLSDNIHEDDECYPEATRAEEEKYDFMIFANTEIKRMQEIISIYFH